MNNTRHPINNTAVTRMIIFFVVAGIHILLILFFAIKVDAAIILTEQPVMVMKLTDVREEEPAPPPPPPPPSQPEQVEITQNSLEAVAETMIETDEEPDQTVIAGAVPQLTGYPGGTGSAAEDYLPMHKVSVAPVFSEMEIKQRLVYPQIALRSKIEGIVYLELFVDRSGQVRQITVLRETPANRGFGEAAVKAFEGIQGKPAEANGAAVAVRYRYPVRFAIRG
ncbi:TonB protein [Treponema primitia ZAS-2]|uniref:TonB protein n=1 Tax=Treponema primitia (strain ATCC BAA-887 / DSM 12427 / ZAS-2) TaxID=545694 RepID=F5YJN8_TREPZ|nr:energy transducer TonB [Treponema primitia]AEF84554.1 TonB protein [Treponema primitia ZAS-2]